MSNMSNKNVAALTLMSAGFALAVSPWLLDFFASEAPTFSAKVIGAGLALVGLAAYVELRDWALRGVFVAALCSFLAPVLLGFHGMAGAAWMHGVAGAIAILTALALLRGARSPARAAGG
jgi:hypothetical protein